MVVKIYISGISGNKEVKKRQQRVLMILDSKIIKYELIDITEPGKEADKEFMQNNAKSNGGTVSDPNPRSALPPQIFNDDEYCGDYDLFDLANEVDTLEQYLKLEVPPEVTPQVETEKETVTNGEVEKKEGNESKETSPAREGDSDNKAEAEDGGDVDKAEETKETDAGDNAEETKETNAGENADDAKDEPAADKKSSRETSPDDKVSSKEPSPAKDEEPNDANESEKEASPERQSVEKEASLERQSVEKEEPKVEKEKSPVKDVESEPKQSKETTPEKDVSVNENGAVSSREQSEEKDSAPESKKDNPSETLIESEQAAAAE